jgi:hypothetical protein
MQLVGITGGIGHGKSTFSADLAKYSGSSMHYESSGIIIEVVNEWRQANPIFPLDNSIEQINKWLSELPQALFDVAHAKTSPSAIGLTEARLKQQPEYYTKLFEYLNQARNRIELQNDPIDPGNKQMHRSLLQWLGGYLARMVNEGVWFDEIVRRVGNLQNIQLVTVGGVRFLADAERIRWAGGCILEIRRPELAETDSTDITERERSLILPESIVQNDSTLMALKQCAATIYKDLGTGQLKKTYRASNYAKA